MKLRFSIEAQREIADVLITISGNNPHVVGAFNRDVRETAKNIKLFPGMGRLDHPASGLRSVVLRRWRYKLYYVVDVDAEEIVIVTVRSTRRRSILDVVAGETDEE